MAAWLGRISAVTSSSSCPAPCCPSFFTRSCSRDRRRHFLPVLLEVLPEHRHQPLGLGIVRGRVCPGAPGREDFGRHFGHLGGNLETEHRILAELDLVELAGQCGPKHGPGEAELHSSTGAVGTAGPAGVHQPDFGAMLGDSLTQQSGIHAGVQRQERCAEAGRKGGRWFGHAPLGACDLCGVAREEVIHRLVGGKPGDRRHDPERVGGEEDDVAGMAAGAAGEMIGDIVDRIAGAGVLGDGVGVEIHRSGGRVEHHILQHGAEHLSCRVDLRLGVRPEPDHLGVTAALEVEHAAVAPAVLIVADQLRGSDRPRGWFCRCRRARRRRRCRRPAPCWPSSASAARPGSAADSSAR